MSYDELVTKISSLQTMPITFKEVQISIDKVLATDFLRKAQSCSLNISSLDDDKQKAELRRLLTTTIVKRFKALAPTFSIRLLKKMLCFMHRGFIKCPLDLLVIDNAVFVKEGTLGDFGDLYEYGIIMFINDDYYHVFDGDDFTMPHGSVLGKEYKTRSKEDLTSFFDFLSNKINEALRPVYEHDVTEPLYKLNTSTVSYGYRGIVRTRWVYGDLNVYLNRQSFDIANDIEAKKSCDYKMIVQEGEDISLYTIHQYFDNDELRWEFEKMPDKV